MNKLKKAMKELKNFEYNDNCEYNESTIEVIKNIINELYDCVIKWLKTDIHPEGSFFNVDHQLNWALRVIENNGYEEETRKNAFTLLKKFIDIYIPKFIETGMLLECECYSNSSHPIIPNWYKLVLNKDEGYYMIPFDEKTIIKLIEYYKEKNKGKDNWYKAEIDYYEDRLKELKRKKKRTE